MKVYREDEILKLGSFTGDMRFWKDFDFNLEIIHPYYYKGPRPSSYIKATSELDEWVKTQNIFYALKGYRPVKHRYKTFNIGDSYNSDRISIFSRYI